MAKQEKQRGIVLCLCGVLDGDGGGEGHVLVGEIHATSQGELGEKEQKGQTTYPNCLSTS